jgi:hypothetical protein
MSKNGILPSSSCARFSIFLFTIFFFFFEQIIIENFIIFTKNIISVEAAQATTMVCAFQVMAQVCLELDVYNKLDTEQVRLLGFLSPLLIHQVITTTTKTTKGTKKKLEKNECVRNYLWRFAFGGSSMMFFYEILGDE